MINDSEAEFKQSELWGSTVVYFKSPSEQRGKGVAKISMAKKCENTDTDCCLGLGQFYKINTFLKYAVPFYPFSL